MRFLIYLACLFCITTTLSCDEPKQNPLELYFNNNQKHLIHKWVHYFAIYDHHFSRFRNTKVKVLEIGVSKGGSLQMWKDYFGKEAQIVGLDIDPDCKLLEEDQISIFIGDQANRNFLRDFVSLMGPFDIVIDDGGHTMTQQITSFEELYPHVSANGVYIVEDLHTSYWSEYGGGYKKDGTFVEYAKNLLDQLNAWHSKDPRLCVNDITKTTRSIHFYDSIIAFEKDMITPPYSKMTGN